LVKPVGPRLGESRSVLEGEDDIFDRCPVGHDSLLRLCALAAGFEFRRWSAIKGATGRSALPRKLRRTVVREPKRSNEGRNRRGQMAELSAEEDVARAGRQPKLGGGGVLIARSGISWS